jgi:hypothetical protein
MKGIIKFLKLIIKYGGIVYAVIEIIEFAIKTFINLDNSKSKEDA